MDILSDDDKILQYCDSPNSSGSSTLFSTADDSNLRIVDLNSTKIIESEHKTKRGPGRPRKDTPPGLLQGLMNTVPKKKSLSSTSTTAGCETTDNACKMNAFENDFCSTAVKFYGKNCAFCNLREFSYIIQGEFVRFEANVDVLMANKNSTETCTFNRNEIGNVNRANTGSNTELDYVGYSKEMNFNSLLDDSPYFFVHQVCAMWSIRKVNISENQNLLETSIEKALSKSCTYCGNFGASIECKMDCTAAYHFPCAQASGCFLIMEGFSMHCTTHIDNVATIDQNVSIGCQICGKRDQIATLIICGTCGEHFHTTCIGLANLPESKAGWNCSQCSICQICRQVENTDSRYIKCEQCQKLYHSACLRPIIASIPKYGWKCKRCRVCTDCGARTPGAGSSSRWHCNYTICDSCYQQRNKGFSCPICLKAYRAAAHKEMVKCSYCNRFVHNTCDDEADISMYHKKKEKNPDYDYMCPCCKTLYKKDTTRRNLVNDNSDYSHHGELSDMCTFDINNPKSLDLYKNTKMRIGCKDGNRSRGAKVIPQRILLLDQFNKRRGGRGKLKNASPLNISNFDRKTARGNNRNQEDDIHAEKKFVLCLAEDSYMILQDVCVMCGSIGQDQEGFLLACSQCGQCYHTYCVNIKTSTITQLKGWRCLDCTICEGCGLKNDEARLILCDECDISYHIYCMDPPLESVPNGIWKCKWCSICQKCKRKFTLKSSSLHRSNLVCTSCTSCEVCFICNEIYKDNDIIIQCTNCLNWLHSECNSDNFSNLYKIMCPVCRPIYDTKSHCSIILAHNDNFPTEDEPLVNALNNVSFTHWIDGVCVSEKGVNHIKAISSDAKKKRKMRPINEVCNKMTSITSPIKSIALGSLSTESDSYKDKALSFKDGMVWTGSKSPPEGFSITTNFNGVNILRKKRQRNLQKLGIGGFVVRNRSFKKDNEEIIENRCEMDSKKKSQRKKLKNKLIEIYPTYLQEAFFGKTLISDQKKALTPPSSSTLSITLPPASQSKPAKMYSSSVDDISTEPFVSTPCETDIMFKNIYNINASDFEETFFKDNTFDEHIN